MRVDFIVMMMKNDKNIVIKNYQNLLKLSNIDDKDIEIFDSFRNDL